jgi:hypothetical protein
MSPLAPTTITSNRSKLDSTAISKQQQRRAQNSDRSIWKPRRQTSAVRLRRPRWHQSNPEHRPFAGWRVYAPRTVSMAKKEQCDGACRPQGLDAHITLICRSPVPELCDMDLVPRRRAQPVSDHQAQRFSSACHHLLLKTTQPRIASQHDRSTTRAIKPFGSRSLYYESIYIE